ncbi:hypothetical protein BC628DRAFT_1309805 [Trametes gibbosa]|uniref:Zinc finger protein 226 n=1 Tax=Trametes gibbosa TaxID=160864 RepID=A0A6B9KD35_9APHY|nr:hypothetical protein BC628DRAFT_1309805 [Trametes gibbosa]QHA24599.1 zinc finger protein 226 [Trametes gibbosa]
MSLDEPYSACPATEFSAPSWSPPLFVPALSYDSLGGSEGSCTTSPKREFEDEFLCFSPTLGSVEEDIFGPAPLLGIYADVNMRERAVQELPLSACVNPLDVMGYVSDGSIPEPDCKTSWDEQATLPTGHSTPASDTRSQAQSPMEQRLSHTPDFTTSYPEDLLVKADFPEDAISAIVSVLKSSVKQEPPESTGVIQPCEVHAPQPQYPNHALANISNDVGVHHPSLAYNPCGARVNFPGPRMPFADLQRQNIQQIQVPQSHQPDALSRGLPEQLLLSPTTPVLNAHTGIELDELRRRAVETRTRHPNAELDKSFLQCFAGRLSERGELLDEYRCYVVGCGQRNKRRDHILVHVGSHVEHRPWQCQHCGMRFLRKNECKRHESSHEGRKPFSCQICAPYQERNFVRQDLLKRHMRVTHGVNDTSRTTASSRKRQQARENENMEDWP